MRRPLTITMAEMLPPLSVSVSQGAGVGSGLTGVGSGLAGAFLPPVYHEKRQVALMGLTMGPFHCPLAYSPVYLRTDTFQVSLRDSGTSR